MSEMDAKIASLYEEEDLKPDVRWLYPDEPTPFQLQMAENLKQLSKKLKYTKYDDNNSRSLPVHY